MTWPLETFQPGFDFPPYLIDLQLGFGIRIGAIAQLGEEGTRLFRERGGRERIGSIDEYSASDPGNPVSTGVMDHDASKKLMRAACERSIVSVFFPTRVEIIEYLMSFFPVLLLEGSPTEEAEDEEDASQAERCDNPPPGRGRPPGGRFGHSDIAKLLEKPGWLTSRLERGVHDFAQLR
jgi:hypothetical protein